MPPRLQAVSQPAQVLIVDTEAAHRRSLRSMLEPEGYRLLAAATGREALDVVAWHAPDLVLLGSTMPGRERDDVMATIRAANAPKKIPVIVVGPREGGAAPVDARSAGAEAFLAAPVDDAELRARVRTLLQAEVVAKANSFGLLPDQAALLDLAPDAIVVRDMQDRIVFWSRGAETLYGWPRHDALGASMHDLLRPQFFEPLEHLEATLLRADRWEGEAVQHRRDGTGLIVASRWALQRDAAGVPARILSITNDITAHKQTEAELMLLTERLSLATAVAKVGVWEWDLATDTLTWDDTMFAIHGRPFVASVPYDLWREVLHPDDRPAVDAALRKVVEEKGQGAGEYRIIRPDGSVRTVSAVETVGLDARGRVARVIGATTDVTERQAAAAALEHVRADQMRFRDDFLSNVSHELRSPLTAIRQFASLLLGGLAGELTTQQREYQQIILKNSRQLQSMIDDLLEATSLENGRLVVDARSVSVGDAVSDSVSTLQETARAKGIAVASDVPLDLPPVHADATRLRQILIILLDNAIKFTPEGGSIRIDACVDPGDAGAVRVDVSDTGCGIAPELASRVFDRLYQVMARPSVSRKGLGLGLHICKELVTLQGGRISVASGPEGVGTTFAFTVPIVSLQHHADTGEGRP